MLEESRPRDREIDKAKARIKQLFEDASSSVLYTIQIETRLEREFFHWITARALHELGNAGHLHRSTDSIQSQRINFFTHPKNRYWKRVQKKLRGLIERIHDPEFTHAVGRHAEMMFDSALARRQFVIHSSNSRTWQEKTWTETNHNLDRIVVRDGIAYGVEIKNTQNYIDLDEFKTKLRLCEFLELTPLFIFRFAPKNYIHQVNRRGGFVLLFEEQLYPWGHGSLLREVRELLDLKVQSPRDIKEGDMARLVKWHQNKLGRD